jgi:Na+-driven multidrug efflux pump
MIIQSTINSFGKEAIAGSTAALSIEGVVHVAFSAFGLAVVSFVGQNNGASKPKRVIRSILLCLSCSCVTALVLGGTALLLKRQLLGIYNPDTVVIDWGCIRMNYQLPFYYLVATIEVLTGSLRGLGYSLGPTIISMFGACAFRVFWILLIFPLDPRMENVMISYPVSWALVAAGTGTMLIIICRKMIKKAVLAGKTKVLKDTCSGESRFQRY